MSQPIDVGMPGDLDLGQGYSLRVTLLNPSTGALVAGGKVGQVVITAVNVAGSASDLPAGSFALIAGPSA